MDIFAQTDILSTPTGQQGLTIFGLLLCVVQSVIGWLTNRDRLKFDVQKNELVHEVKSLTVRADECAKDRAEMHEQIKTERLVMEQRVREMETRLARITQEGRTHG